MFELFAGSDAVRRRVEGALTAHDARPAAAHEPRVRRRRRAGVRSISAAALRSLAERLEPSPTT
jgi:hypothetical protein